MRQLPRPCHQPLAIDQVNSPSTVEDIVCGNVDQEEVVLFRKLSEVSGDSGVDLCEKKD